MTGRRPAVLGNSANSARFNSMGGVLFRSMLNCIRDAGDRRRGIPGNGPSVEFATENGIAMLDADPREVYLLLPKRSIAQ